MLKLWYTSQLNHPALPLKLIQLQRRPNRNLLIRINLGINHLFPIPAPLILPPPLIPTFQLPTPGLTPTTPTAFHSRRNIKATILIITHFSVVRGSSSLDAIPSGIHGGVGGFGHGHPASVADVFDVGVCGYVHAGGGEEGECVGAAVAAGAGEGFFALVDLEVLVVEGPVVVALVADGEVPLAGETVDRNRQL